MHIMNKMINEVINVLPNKYGTQVALSNLQLFMTPIASNVGVPDGNEFQRRIGKSLKIIKCILDVNAKGEIIRFLGRVAGLESNIQEAQPRVRDHVVHAVNTFITGVYILEKVRFPHLIPARFDYPFMWKLCGPLTISEFLLKSHVTLKMN